MSCAFPPTRISLLLGATALIALTGGARADQVIPDDLIVQGSACVGFDCVNGESFGFDTLRLKENNLRIRAFDTSSSASFPTRDWELTFNETSNGGADKFSVTDIDANRIPFTIEGNTPSNTLYVDNAMRIGVGTSTPVVTLHTKMGNTPTLRLEQDGSSGFTPQVWDLAGNETNFFIRDSTNGSRLPFRIFPNAPSNALNIEGSTGDIGVGITAPTAALHVNRTNGTGQMLVQDTGGTGPLQMLRLENDGAVQLYMNNTTNAAAQWMFSAGANLLIVPNETASNAVFDLAANGNLTIDGTLTELSDKNAKMAIEPVDTGEILAKVTALPVTSWTYIDEAETGVRHIGPMAQDFYAAFGTGHTDKGIATLDSTGVALAAIQALSAENADLRARLDLLERRVLAD